MNPSTKNVPLWLDINPELIDQNFEKVLEYLKNSNKTDSFYQITLEILFKRGKDLLETLKTRPVYFGESTTQDKDTLIFETRLLAAILLSNSAMESATKKRLVMPMLNLLGLLVPAELCSDLLMLMVDNLILKEEPRILFSWDDIIKFEPQILAHKIINSMTFENATPAELSYEGKGTLLVANDTLGIVPMNEDNLKIKRFQLAPSIEILDGKISLITVKNEKLKKTEENSIEALEKFTKDFIASQMVCIPSRNRPKKTYRQGDMLNAKVVDLYHNTIKVRSIDPEYETLEGRIVFSEQNILFYSFIDFAQYLHINDEIEVELASYEDQTFSLKSTFVRYLIEDVLEANEHIGKVSLARVMNIGTNKRGDKQIDWLTEDGYSVHTPYDDRFSRDTFGKVKITGHGTGIYFGYINATIIGESYNYFDINKVKKSIIEGFVFEPSWDEDAKKTMLNEGSIRDLMRMMIQYQKTVVNPKERFKVLCVLKIMASLINSEEYQSYIGFIAEYMKQLIRFAKGDYNLIKELEPAQGFEGIDVVETRCNIVKILKAYGHENENESLENIIKESTDETLTKIAKLTLSCNNIGDIIPAATKNIIKQEITKSLSVETSDETNLDEENGIYLGIEDRHQEFKTSFVYPPNYGMLPNYFLQEKNIFKVLCGFLNTQAGGTLYIGVSDLGYVVGFEADMVYLKIDTIDAYMRFIQDEAKKFFDIDELALFQMKPMYDEKVLAIKVEPYEDGIVEIDGTAYIRINNETLVMTDKMKTQMRAKKNAAKTK
ncbi:MAG: ATP-binding protein [Bacteroidales bacterium]|nr:ATP-binding protein [Bacteroidales bacterium]